MTMAKVSSKKTCYTYGHGPLINLLHLSETQTGKGYDTAAECDAQFSVGKYSNVTKRHACVPLEGHCEHFKK